MVLSILGMLIGVIFAVNISGIDEEKINEKSDLDSHISEFGNERFFENNEYKKDNYNLYGDFKSTDIAKYPSTDWSFTEVVSIESPDISHQSSLYVDVDGVVHVAWKDYSNYGGSGNDIDIFYKERSVDGFWSVTEIVSTESTSNSYGPSLYVDVDGVVHVAWNDFTDYGGSGIDLDIFYKERSVDGFWSVTEIVSTESPDTSIANSLYVDVDGVVHVAWSDYSNYGGSGNDIDIFYKERSVDGFWSVTEIVSTESALSSWDPSLFIDDGVVHVAWDDSSNYACGNDNDIFYKYRSSGGSWSTTEVVSTESTSNSYGPSLYVDVDGVVHVAWKDYSNYGGSGYNDDIFYKYRSSGGSWSTTEVVSTESTNNSENPSLSVYNGVVHVAWDDDTNYGGSGNDIDIFYKERSFGSWSTTNVVSTESTNNSENPSLSVYNGVVHVAWDDLSHYGESLTDRDIFYKYKEKSISIPLHVGWNLVGWYQKYDTTAKSLSENITGCISVSMWDNEGQTYKAYIVGGPEAFDFTVSRGMGLFIDVNIDSIWYGEG